MMAERHVYACDQCGMELPAVFRGGSNDYPALPELPDGWWVVGQRDATAATFCSVDCIAKWADILSPVTGKGT